MAGEVSDEDRRAALAAAEVGTWSWDPRSDAIRWSPEACALLGVDTDASPSNIAELLALIHPDDHAGLHEAMRAALSAKPHIRLEYRVQRPHPSTSQIQARESRRRIPRVSSSPTSRPRPSGPARVWAWPSCMGSPASITGAASDSASASGFRIVLKPFSPTGIATALREVLDRAR